MALFLLGLRRSLLPSRELALAPKAVRARPASLRTIAHLLEVFRNHPAAACVAVIYRP